MMHGHKNVKLMNRRLRGPKNRSERFGKQKNPSPFPTIVQNRPRQSGSHQIPDTEALTKMIQIFFGAVCFLDWVFSTVLFIRFDDNLTVGACTCSSRGIYVMWPAYEGQAISICRQHRHSTKKRQPLAGTNLKPD